MGLALPFADFSVAQRRGAAVSWRVPGPGQLPEYRQIVRDYRELATRLVVGHLDAVLHRQMVSTAPGALLDGQWPPHG